MTPRPVQTRLVDATGRVRALKRARIRLRVERGLDVGQVFEVERGLARIGSSPDSDICLDHDTVSGRHLEIECGDEGFCLRDVGSTNGTWVGGLRIQTGVALPGTVLQLGEVVVRLEAGEDYEVLLGAPGSAGLVGESAALRESLALLIRAADGTAPVLLEGETGVGKERFARAVHRLSPRVEGPFDIVDCSALPRELAEAELFGVVAGAYTGAEPRPGAFERAHEGTLFLDEIGELPLPLQAKLLRILETGSLRRVGGTQTTQVNVRLVSATHRDLQGMVADGEFRADLFFRLNVLRIEIPPLRRRREDIPLLASAILAELGSSPRAVGLDEAALALLSAYPWPGNVRELRNVLMRATALGASSVAAGLLTQGPRGSAGASVLAGQSDLPFHEARERATEAFERAYVERLLARHGGSVVAAARAAGIPRQTLRRIIVRVGLTHPAPDEES